MKRTVTAMCATALVVGAFSIGRATAPGPGTSNGATPGVTPPVRPTEPTVVAAGARLVPFDACEDLAAYAAGVALDAVGPHGFTNGHLSQPVTDDLVADEMAASGRISADAAAPAPAREGGTGVSGTNVQEAGVDEPDIAKTDGRLLATVAGDGTIRLVDVAGPQPEPIGSYALTEQRGHVQPELLLSGDRLLALWTADAGHGPVASSQDARTADDDELLPVPQHTPTTQLELIDVSDPSAPTGIARYRVDGAYLSARLIGSDVRVAVRSTPTGLDLRAPVHGGLEGERAAEEHNREAIRSADGEDWLPYAVHERLDGGAAVTTSEGTAMDCLAVHRPPEPSGLATTSIVTLDMTDDDLSPEDVTAVFAPAQTVYSSGERMYVALGAGMFTAMPVDVVGPEPGAMPPPNEDTGTTSVHAFDVSTPATTSYVASGEIDGRILDQWSLSEHDGFLRVAVTEEADASRGASESAVVVLEERGDRLEEIGRIGGLGKGERIYAVRFEGATGYVVTFRQVDPLYTIDLSDPASPQVRGELKILGYSAYLHPVAPGRLLGVGQDATDEGRVVGTQVSLFDIGDLDAPERVANVTLAGAHSEVEADHRAFVWWAPRDLAFVPVVSHGPVEEDSARPGGGQPFAGLVAYRVGDARVEEVARVTHAGEDGGAGTPIRRSFVVGDRLVTVSATGVQANSLDTFEATGFAALGQS